MKILQVITDTDRRGAQVFAVDLGNALGRLGHELTTVALAPGTRSASLDVAVLGARPRGISTLRALRAAMGEVDISIAHGSSTLLACGLAGLGPGRPFVYRQISDSKFWAPTILRRLRVAAYLRLPRRVVALSDGATDTLASYLWVPRKTICTVPNGVPSTRFEPASDGDVARARVALGLPDAFIVLYIGALAVEKGAHIAVRAIAALPSIHLAIAGGGPERGQLQRLSDELAPGRVHFVGDLPDAQMAYHASDLVALPSLGGDSMPATLIEAGFCGLPSVTTPVGGIAEIVIDNVTGLITEPGDVGGTIEAFDRLHRDSNLRLTMGRAAKRHCLDRFEIDVVAKLWDAVLRG